MLAIVRLVQLEVFADIWCPFAYVGLHTAASRRDTLGRPDVALRIRAWPLELVNGRPLDPTITAEHVGELRAQVAPLLFSGFDPSRFPTTTLPALSLAASAYGRSDAAGEAISFALRFALFERGLDVSRNDVLASIASTFRLPGPSDDDLDSVLSDWQEGQRRGVMGSPHFFCDGRDVFCPSLVISRGVDGQTEIRRNTAKLDTFLTSCLEG